MLLVLVYSPHPPPSPFPFSGAHFRLRFSSATEDDVFLTSFLCKTCFITVAGRVFAPLHLRSSYRASLLIHSPISAEKRNIGRTVKPRLTATSVIRSPRYYGPFFHPPSKTAIQFLVKNCRYYDQFVLAH